MEVEPLLLYRDKEEDMAALMTFLKSFNPRTVPLIEEANPGNAVLLLNKYTDV